VTVALCEGQNVLCVYAPSAVEFDVPAHQDRLRVAGQLGILSGAYQDPACHTEGVLFAVEYTLAGGSPQVVFQRYLDPWKQPEDRDMQAFVTWLPPGGTGKLVLRALPPPGKTERLCWSYWTDVEIEGLGASAKDRAKSEDSEGGYRRLIRHVREAARTALPQKATVLVASHGDDNLVRLPGATGWHFPRAQDGTYLGYSPEEDEATAQLEALRAQGAQFLLFPRTGFWWLTDYPQFAKHLNDRYRRIHDDRECVIYQLSKRKGG
jgi:hypothetical protein